MGLLRYIVQGFGWELGREAAREGIDAVKSVREPEPLTRRQQAKLAKARDKQAARERKERDAAIARKQAEIEQQLAALKKRR